MVVYFDHPGNDSGDDDGRNPHHDVVDHRPDSHRRLEHLLMVAMRL